MIEIPLRRKLRCLVGVRSLRAAPGVAGLAALAMALAGCASLPISGPTGAEVERAARDGKQPTPFRLVELDVAAALPGPGAPPPVELARLLPPPPTDMIGPGDVLDVAVYEAGVTLFAGGGARDAGIAAQGGGFSGGAQVAHMPPQRVDDSGHIRLPYVGRLRAAGHTPEELATIVRGSLKGMSQNPQVLVSIVTTIANSVIVGGEIGHPGRLVLNTNRESLSDAIALAGGYRGDAKDLSVRIVRQGRDVEYRLSDVLGASDRDMPVLPGDRIEVLRKPLSFSVLGAPGKVEQMGFPTASASLAEAVAMAGGANPNLGNAKAIFVFRYVRGDDGSEAPVVYHLNMMNPGAYFLSQRFAMRDKDVLYVGNAAANQPTKLIALISQLFSPVLTSAVVVQNALP